MAIQPFSNTFFLPEHPFDAGWSSPVARQAHNLKVVGSNPTPATNTRPRFGGVFCVWRSRGAGALSDSMTAHPDQIYDIAVIG